MSASTLPTLADIRDFLAPPAVIASHEWLDAQGRHAKGFVAGGMLRLCRASLRGPLILRFGVEHLDAVADLLPARITWPGRKVA